MKAQIFTSTAEEFASQRRAAQDRYAAALAPRVEQLLATGGDTDSVLALAGKLYVEAYNSDTDETLKPEAFNEFIELMESALAKAGPDSDVQATSLMIATAALNFSAIAAADADPESLEMQWVDMDDEAVRKTHAEADGQTRPPGVPFTVGGFDMAAPGDTRAPISEWINCRCMLRPARVEETALRASLEADDRLLAILRAALGHEPDAEEKEGYVELLRASLEMRDVPADEREKDAEAGRAMPDGSYPIDNCQDLQNAIQAIGRASDPDATKAHIRKRKTALGCPDVELPDTWAAVEALVASDSGDHAGDSSVVVVAIPADDDPINGIGDEQKHVTLAYMGEFGGDPQAVHKAVEDAAATTGPFAAAVSGHGQLGPDGAKVLFVEAPEIADVRDRLTQDETIAAGLQGGDAHPHFVPHMTIDYADEMPEDAKALGEVKIDRLAVWQGDAQTTYPLGVAVPEGPPLAEVAAALEEQPQELAADGEEVPAPVVEELPTDPMPSDGDLMAAIGSIPIHGVLAPEGVLSGDGRGFREGALTNRPLPLPLTHQDRTAEGHDDAVVVAMIEKIQIIDNEQHFSGHMRMTDDADAAVGLMVDFGGRYGLSIDADEAVGEYDEGSEEQWFSESRTSGAAMVNIPAFPQAYVALGPHPILDAEIPDDASPEDAVENPALDPIADDGEPLVAAGAFLAAIEQFKDLAPGKTEDGPGWLTHPVDTDRLRDYWVRGPGAAKINWGVPGDFNRCRVNVAEYVKPQYLNGYCANRHYDALGFWPGRPVAADTESFVDEALVAAAAEGVTMAPALSIVAGNGGGWCAPSAWFDKPPEIKDNPNVGVVIEASGRTYGRIANWGECHIGLPGVCTSAPTSPSDYAYFKTGQVPVREGGYRAVGSLTVGGGHADMRKGYQGAVAHYDSTSAVWADANVGEDDIGIWFAGSVRPGITEDTLYAARASGRLSGDWRGIHGVRELTAALSVNSGGFPIPEFGLKDGEQISLVAAGIVPLAETEDEVSVAAHGDLAAAMDPRTFAAAVIAALDERDSIKELRSELEGAAL